MTTTPEEQPYSAEEDSVLNAAKDTEETPTAAKPKKAAAKPRKKVAKKKAATKKAAPRKQRRPADETVVDKIPSVEEIKEQFAEAAVEPTKKAIDTWQEIAGVAREGLKDLKEAGVGILSGFLGNKKKED